MEIQVAEAASGLLLDLPFQRRNRRPALTQRADGGVILRILAPRGNLRKRIHLSHPVHESLHRRTAHAKLEPIGHLLDDLDSARPKHGRVIADPPELNCGFIANDLERPDFPDPQLRQIVMGVAEVGDVGRSPEEPKPPPRSRGEPLSRPPQLAERLKIQHIVAQVRRDVPLVEPMPFGNIGTSGTVAPQPEARTSS
jgi:hypothetical protein